MPKRRYGPEEIEAKLRQLDLPQHKSERHFRFRHIAELQAETPPRSRLPFRRQGAGRPFGTGAPPARGARGGGPQARRGGRSSALQAAAVLGAAFSTIAGACARPPAQLRRQGTCRVAPRLRLNGVPARGRVSQLANNHPLQSQMSPRYRRLAGRIERKPLERGWTGLRPSGLAPAQGKSARPCLGPSAPAAWKSRPVIPV